MQYMYVNQSKEKDTLYYIPEANFLCIVPIDKKSLKDLHYVYGSAALVLYKRLSTEPTKKCLYSKQMRLLTMFMNSIDDRSSDPYESLAGIEQIVERVTLLEEEARQQEEMQVQGEGAQPRAQEVALA